MHYHWSIRNLVNEWNEAKKLFGQAERLYASMICIPKDRIHYEIFIHKYWGHMLVDAWIAIFVVYKPIAYIAAFHSSLGKHRAFQWNVARCSRWTPLKHQSAPYTVGTSNLLATIAKYQLYVDLSVFSHMVHIGNGRSTINIYQPFSHIKTF